MGQQIPPMMPMKNADGSMKGVTMRSTSSMRSGSAKCEYCGRYGALGSCEGCGAPNVPVMRAFESDDPEVLWHLRLRASRMKLSPNVKVWK